MVAPSIFIGSSRQTTHIAKAIQAEIEPEAEGAAWPQGTFELGANHLADLARIARVSDFAIFVFAPDDTANINEKPAAITRDNVVFELGLFCGAIGEDRCFFVKPLNADIHIPSDLAGITHGTYNDKRSDKNWRSAVGPFCEGAKQKIKKLGLREWRDHPSLSHLALQYEFCDEIIEEQNRVQQKDKTYAQMCDYCRNHDVDKVRMLREPRLGFYVAVAAAIRAKPRIDDADILRSIDARLISAPNACYKMLYAAQALFGIGNLSDNERAQLLDWLDRLPCDREPFRRDLAALRR